jgi:SpoVK/Ycf46/Vps4 family AAA+-type ATPase
MLLYLTEKKVNLSIEPLFYKRAWKKRAMASSVPQQIKALAAAQKEKASLQRDKAETGRPADNHLAIFYGPAASGKKQAAFQLGQLAGKEVYRINLSGIVSKYIGETEKNLDLLFSKLRDKDWILYFDEADSLFGKRTDVKDSHDKYANAEISYLLQKIETYNGLVILAGNNKKLDDESLHRRFQTILRFPKQKKKA